MWTRNNDVPDRNMLEHSIYPSPGKPATSPLCSPYYRYSSEPSSSFCILSFLVRATSIDQTFYPATHYLAAVWLDSRHGPNRSFLKFVMFSSHCIVFRSIFHLEHVNKTCLIDIRSLSHSHVVIATSNTRLSCRN